MKKGLLIALFLFSFGCTSTIDSTPKSSGDNKAPIVNNKESDDIKGGDKDDNEGGNKNDIDGGSLAPAPTVSVNPLPSASATTPVTTDTTVKVQFATIKTIMDSRCVSCHSASRPSAGVALDTFESIKINLSGIKRETVDRTSMPPRNSTGMTTEERKALGDWISQGANN